MEIALQELPEFHVFIGSGDYLIYREVCRQVTVTIQDAAITQELFVLTMEGANVVLGLQWLETLGVVKTNYKQLTLEFECGGTIVKLQGDAQIADAGVSNQGLRRMMARREVAYFCHLKYDPSIQAPQEIKEIKEVLDKFQKSFRKPTELPPDRTTDHRITLITGAQPVNVNSYRYPYFQKNEIERLTKEMLQQGLIRPSISPFSSPVLLVRKKMDRGDFALITRLLIP